MQQADGQAHSVVGWDASPAADNALEWAAVHQRGVGRLDLVRVWDEEDQRAPREREASAVNRTAEAADRLHASFPNLEIAHRFVEGRRGHVLCSMSHADTLLVLGERPRHSRMPFTGLALADRIAAAADGRVAIVPHDHEAHQGLVVVGVDGTLSGMAAIEVAAQEALRLRRRLLAVHGWAEATDWEVLLPFDAKVFETLETRHRALLDESLLAVVRSHPHLQVVRRARHQDPVDAVVEATLGASLLVLGKHGKRISSTMPLGSVARGILRRAQVPTIVVGWADVRAAAAVGTFAPARDALTQPA